MMKRYYIKIYYEAAPNTYMDISCYAYGISEEDAKIQAMKWYKEMILPKVGHIEVQEILT